MIVMLPFIAAALTHRPAHVSRSETREPLRWDLVARCESGGNWHINTGNGYYGGVQFSEPTWVSEGGTEFAATADLATKAQQIEAAERLLRDAGIGSWPVCGAYLESAA